MTGHGTPTDPLDQLAALQNRGKEPNSARVLNTWIARAEKDVGIDQSQLGWLIATTVVVAALQRATGVDGRSRFVLKGGTYLQHRLSWSGRATKDVDGIARGDIEEFLVAVDEVLAEPWGPLTLRRSAIEVINTPAKVVKPRRFNVFVELRGTAWRKIQVEIAPDEAGATDESDRLRSPALSHFGLPSPDELVGIAVRFQIAQKVHACTDPHDPPAHINDRARDLVDLLLLRALVDGEGTPSTEEIREACHAVFTARADEAQTLGRPRRTWPPTVVAHPHWPTDYTRAAAGAGLEKPLQDAVDTVNDWIAAIDAAT